MNSRRKALTTASMRSYVESGLLVVTVTGLVTPRAADEVFAEARAIAAQARVRGIIGDYRGAILALTPAAMTAALCRNDERGILSVPAANVVAEDTAQFWASYAWLLAGRGIVRGAFTGDAPAWSWLQRKAAVWAQEAGRPAPTQDPPRVAGCAPSLPLG